MLAAHAVASVVDNHDGATPTPVIPHVILSQNFGDERGRADGIVVTPSHDPPDDGGFKYSPPRGGAAWAPDLDVAFVNDPDADRHGVVTPRKDPAACAYRPWDALTGRAPHLTALQAISIDLAMAP